MFLEVHFYKCYGIIVQENLENRAGLIKFLVFDSKKESLRYLLK